MSYYDLIVHCDECGAETEISMALYRAGGVLPCSRGCGVGTDLSWHLKHAEDARSYGEELAEAIGGEVTTTGGGCMAIQWPAGDYAKMRAYLLLTNGNADLPDGEDVVITPYVWDERWQTHEYHDEMDEFWMQDVTVPQAAEAVQRLAQKYGIESVRKVGTVSFA